jgi:hypothetical protein
LIHEKHCHQEDGRADSLAVDSEFKSELPIRIHVLAAKPPALRWTTGDG